MALELITGKSGTPHVDSADIGALNACIFGPGSYILSGCELTAVSANQIHIAPGEIILEGRHVRITGAGEDVSIVNGTTGYKRNDIIAINYSVGNNNIESVSFEVIAGTPASSEKPADPSVFGGSILDGDSSVQYAFARVKLDGINLDGVEALFEERSVSGVDSIVAQGTSGDWTFFKYSSGWADCYYQTEYSTAIDQPWGSGYDSGTKSSIPLPFPIKKPHFVGSANGTTGNSWLLTYYDSGAVADSDGYYSRYPHYAITSFGKYELRKYRICLHASGFWK